MSVQNCIITCKMYVMYVTAQSQGLTYCKFKHFLGKKGFGRGRLFEKRIQWKKEMQFGRKKQQHLLKFCHVVFGAELLVVLMRASPSSFTPSARCPPSPPPCTL